MDRLLVSIVTPVRRGAPFLRSLLTHLDAIRSAWDRDQVPFALAEAVFVVDGAEDASEKILQELSAQYPWLRVITLSRAFGRQAATIAGVLHTSGDWVISLNEVAQPKSEQVVKLLRDAAMSGGDVIYIDSHDDDSTPSKWERWLSRVTGVTNMADHSSQRLMRGSIARAAAAVSARRTNFDVALRWFTTRIKHLALDLAGEQARAEEGAELSLLSLGAAWRRIVVTENRLPAAGFAAGGAAMTVSIALTGLLLLIVLFGLRGYLVDLMFLSLAVLFLGGVVLTATSVVLSYVAAHFLQSLGQPVYFEIDRSRDQLLLDYFSRPESHAALRATSQSS